MDNYKMLRASRIGSLCDRAIFYSVNGAEEITSEKSQRIFEVGRVLEPVIISWLRHDGWKVQRNLFLNSNEGMSLSISLNGGIIEAHPDCVISREDSGLILADIKTMNDSSFRSLKREGTAKSHPQYADQLTIYAHALRERTQYRTARYRRSQQEQLRGLHRLLPVRAGEIRDSQRTCGEDFRL